MAREVNQFGHLEIPNRELGLDDLPEPGVADWGVIEAFALTFDGYALHAEDCGDVANHASERFRSSGALLASLSDLRTCLFYEQRRWRHFAESPDPESLTYIRKHRRCHPLQDQVGRSLVGAVDFSVSVNGTRRSWACRPLRSDGMRLATGSRDTTGAGRHTFTPFVPVAYSVRDASALAACSRNRCP